jgi:hypothetical protein
MATLMTFGSVTAISDAQTEKTEPSHSATTLNITSLLFTLHPLTVDFEEYILALFV